VTRILAVAVALMALAGLGGSDAPRILERAPSSPDPAAHYLFYLHGRIIELQGPEAVSPIFGRYEYQGILEAFAARGFVVVAEVRSDEAGAAFVEATARQVRGLLEAGVPADQITVMGFSKGGALTLGVSALVAADEVHYAILAGCFGGAESAARQGPNLRGRFLSLNLRGRFLSLLDRSDRFSPSCKALFAHAAHVRDKTEHVFETELDHGLFYEPRAEWVDRVVTWARPAPSNR
jgi:hypothetical protein